MGRTLSRDFYDAEYPFHADIETPNLARLWRGFEEAARVLRRGGLMGAVAPNFYVHTDQPLEFRASYGGWKRLVEAAGFQILRVKTDRGPAILKNRKPVRILTRLVLRLLS